MKALLFAPCSPLFSNIGKALGLQMFNISQIFKYQLMFFSGFYRFYKRVLDFYALSYDKKKSESKINICHAVKAGFIV